jgi:hypothetical protein
MQDGRQAGRKAGRKAGRQDRNQVPRHVDTRHFVVLPHDGGKAQARRNNAAERVEQHHADEALPGVGTPDGLRKQTGGFWKNKNGLGFERTGGFFGNKNGWSLKKKKRMEFEKKPKTEWILNKRMDCTTVLFRNARCHRKKKKTVDSIAWPNGWEYYNYNYN